MMHMRGNPDPETLQSVENLEKILRDRNKEKVIFSLFGTSSSQYLYSIAKSEWGVRAERLLTKSKYEFDLRKVGVSSSILRSYLLDSLWLNLETLTKAKETAPIIQNTSLHNPHPTPNQSTPMAVARFYPLALPLFLHDLPLNYA